MRRVKFVALMTMLAITGCSSLGLTQSKSIDDRLAYAEGVNTAVVEAAAASVEAKTISKAEGQKVLQLADQAHGLILDARAAQKLGDLSTASSKLQLATVVLTQLQTYLQARGTK